MIKKTLLFSFLTIFSVFSVVLSFGSQARAASIFDDVKKEACNGTQLEAGTTNSCDDKAVKKVDDLLANIINLISAIGGVIAVIMIIVQGLRYITANGDSNSIGSAKHGIIYAVVGLVIIALAQILVKFVINKTS